MIGSDAMAMLQCTNQFVEIEDEEFIKLTFKTNLFLS